MGKKEKGSDKKSDKKKKAAKADKPGTAKYTYPKDCTSDGDKKKFRSLMRAGKPWEGPGKSGGSSKKKAKKDHGPEKAVILDGKGKKIRTEDNPGAKKKKKETASAED